MHASKCLASCAFPISLAISYDRTINIYGSWLRHSLSGLRDGLRKFVVFVKVVRNVNVVVERLEIIFILSKKSDCCFFERELF